MATITIQDILGSDNVGASRKIIASNQKILCDAINKIQTFLDPTNNGTISVGNATIVKAPNVLVDTVIFTLQASGQITGNLNITQDLTVVRNATFNANLSIAKQFTVTRSQNVSNETLFSKIESGISIDDLLILKRNASVPVTLQIPTTAIDVLGFVSGGTVLGKNNIDFAWNISSIIGTPGTTSKVMINDGYDGQLLVLTNSGFKPSNDAIKFVHQPTGTTNIALEKDIVEFNTISTDALLSQISVILKYDLSTTTWKVISIVKPVGVTCVQYA